MIFPLKVFCVLCFFSTFAVMKLHIFNPEHDLALAANLKLFTAPHAGRQLRTDLSFIPALWAEEGDFVLVDDIDDARDKVRHLGSRYVDKVEFITRLQLQKVFADTFLIDSVHPWGWDSALREELKRMGCPDIMLPTDENIQRIRALSSRQWAAAHLQKGVKYVESVSEVRQLVANWGKAVVKAPWSSSGRGVKFISADNYRGEGAEFASFDRWVSNIISRQGGVTVEPYYNKVKDFGMEFEVKNGKVVYRGLSLFQTVKNAYTGNLLASEDMKVELMAPYVSAIQLAELRDKLMRTMEPYLKDVYQGPFGIDMMVCAGEDDELFVNSCIELNLRRTMGHVALALGQSALERSHIMRVDFDGNRYHLHVMPGKPSEDAPLH